MTRRDSRIREAADRLRAISLGGSIGMFEVAVRKVIEDAIAEHEKPLIETVQRLHNDYHDSWRNECHAECHVAMLLKEYEQ